MCHTGGRGWLGQVVLEVFSNLSGSVILLVVIWVVQRWLDQMVLEVFSNLNDSMILLMVILAVG